MPVCCCILQGYILLRIALEVAFIISVVLKQVLALHAHLILNRWRII